MRWRTARLALTAGAMLAAAGAAEAASVYGCFRASEALNIRDGAFSGSAVIATAKRGEILIKRKRFCTLRGFWCAVRTRDGVEGWADKAYMDPVDCPPAIDED